MNNYDAIIIGAGHNGLTNAAYLAKAGLNVVVVEKNEYIGGASVTREPHEGWKYSSCSYVCSMMRQAIHRDLDLARHGLLLVPYLGGVTFGDGDERLFSYHDEQAAYLELKRHSPHDADAMHRFQADLTRYAQFIRKTLMRTPPDPTSFRPRDIMELLYLAKQFWALGEKEIYEYVRFFTMSAAEYLEDYFENDLIKTTMASPGIIGTALGVYSPGSSYILLHHVMGDVDGSIGAWGLARGGMGAISDAIAGALAEHGGEIRTNAGVQQVIVENRKAVGVVLENGDEIRARVVVSNLDAKRTFTKIMDKNDLPDSEQLTEIGKHISFTEQQAERGESELKTVLLLQLLSKHIGDELDCVVTGLTNFGVFAKSKKFGIEGLIAIDDLGPDQWQFIPKAQSIVAVNCGVEIHVGRAIKATIVSVNLPARQLNLAPSEPLIDSKRLKKKFKAYHAANRRHRRYSFAARSPLCR
ncbi:MAG: FAD-dependent oxidoreductase [Proteobacteria bacterium]|nr:FAD-dependent oxidoreductase [Pseudomonadota bacterium]